MRFLCSLLCTAAVLPMNSGTFLKSWVIDFSFLKSVFFHLSNCCSNISLHPLTELGTHLLIWEIRSYILKVEKNACLMCEEPSGEIHNCNGPDRKIYIYMTNSPAPKIIAADCEQRENLLSLHASYCSPCFLSE